MFHAIRNMSIYRRLFFVFALATIIPGIVIVSLGAFYITSSQSRSDAVHKSFEAKDLAAQQQSILQHLNPLVTAHFSQVVADAPNNPIINGDPSFAASGALIENDILSLVVSFQKNLLTYQQQYDLQTSPNMDGVRSILLADDVQSNQPMINTQHKALTTLVQHDWADYHADITSVLTDLHQKPVVYAQAYKDLNQSNSDFLPLNLDWQTVFNSATDTGNAVAHVGFSLWFPLLLAPGLSLLFIIVFVAVAAALVNRTISRPLRGLVALTQRVADGDMNERAIVDSGDEIGKVAKSMNGMLDNIVRLARAAEARHADIERADRDASQ